MGSRLGVVGSGVAGLTTAYVAATRHDAQVTVFEADDRPGGHADTHTVVEDGRELSIDTGFIVHNERTYPTLLRIFHELDVPTQDSEMSMSVRDDGAHHGRGLEYAGALGIRGLFPGGHNLLRPSFWRMLLQIPRFHRRARALLRAGAEARGGQTLRDFLDENHFSSYFRRHFIQPLVAAVWSCDPALALEYPARYLFEFLSHHGMLQVFGSPQWRTVSGGSREYVDRVAATIEAHGGEVRTGSKVLSVSEGGDAVRVTDGNGLVHRFDAVVVATHPGQALDLLGEPTAAQREVLGSMPFSHNVAQLHTDTSLLPRHHDARASWNQLDRPGHEGVAVTYDLTRLMRLPTTRRYLVSLGASDLVDPDQVLATMDYEHPIYTPDSVAALARADALDSDRLAFAGAWRGWGFHEDGARAGAAAAARVGLGWEAHPEPAAISVPAIYRTTITHTRRTPVLHRFRHTSHTWLVDLDRLPRERGLLAGAAGFFLGRFEARDHLGKPDRTIRENLAAFLDLHGLDLSSGTVLMAAHPRAWGYCFNPITVYWCRDHNDAALATVVEVHNTYGDRHAYLVHPDEAGRARVDKQLYVSPFHGTDGHYDLVVPEPTNRLTVTVRLTSGDGEVFDAAMRGRIRGSGARAALRAAPEAALDALRIRHHGIALWLRRVPIRPRPTHHQEGVR